jgi:CBS domain-containing protein
MLVKDVMTEHPVSVTPGTGVKGALTKLAFVGVTALPVVDDEGRLCGIVSEADFIGEVIDDPRAHERPVTMRPLEPARTVEDVYTRTPVTVRPHDDVTAVVEVMTSKGFKSLPVVDDQQRLLGMISRSDVVRALARDDDAITKDIARLLTELGHPDWSVHVVSGVVDITGPADTGQRSLAHALARTVPGVVEVRIR